VPFVAKLYFRWVGGLLTDAGKTPGPDGVRAWLKAGKLVCAFLVSVCASIGYGYSFWGIFATSHRGSARPIPRCVLRFEYLRKWTGEKPRYRPSGRKSCQLVAEGKISAEERPGASRCTQPLCTIRSDPGREHDAHAARLSCSSAPR